MYYSFFKHYKKEINSESFMTHILASSIFALSLAFLTNTVSNIIYYFFTIEFIDTDSFISKMTLIYFVWAFFIYFYAGYKNHYLKYLEEKCSQELKKERKLNAGLILLFSSITMFIISAVFAYWPNK